MPDRPNKLTQFWNELKRRKVIKVIAMYAATAFIIIEVGDIMLPRLGLPDWTVTFIIILLIIGFRQFRSYPSSICLKRLRQFSTFRF